MVWFLPTCEVKFYIIAVTFIVETKAFSITEILPVCCFINGPKEMEGINKRFQQHYWIAEDILPIDGKPFVAQG